MSGVRYGAYMKVTILIVDKAMRPIVARDTMAGERVVESAFGIVIIKPKSKTVIPWHRIRKITYTEVRVGDDDE